LAASKLHSFVSTERVTIFLALLTTFVALAATFLGSFHYNDRMALSLLKEKYSTLSLTGKRAIVAGGTSGIGEGIAERLAKANVEVTILGRNEERGKAVLAKLNAASPSLSHRFVATDLSLIRNANAFARAEVEAGKPLDFLVLSAGIVQTSLHKTVEDVDTKMAVHYFTRVALAMQLQPLLQKSSDARVLTILSGGIHSAYKDYEQNFQLTSSSYMVNSANAAGFYNDIAIEQLAALNPSAAYFHAAPGFIKTNWGSELPWYSRGPVRFLQLFATSIESVGEFMCAPLFNPELKATQVTTNEKSSRNWHIVNRHGGIIDDKITNLHHEAKDVVWRKTLDVLNKHDEH